MKCAWNEFLSVLPMHMRRDVDDLGRQHLQELRLRLGKPPMLVLGNRTSSLSRTVTADDLNYIINTASRYSPWLAATAARGYITAAGGHRIGMCGECVLQQGNMTGIRTVTSLCIRVARDFSGIAKGIPLTGSVLILGPPGSGKTTLLRDLIRQRSNAYLSGISVVDERGELFPVHSGFSTGDHTDVLTGCSKSQGIDVALRTMGPSCIAVDEITSQDDCAALIQAGWCGVSLLATAHAADTADLLSRPVYRPLADSKLFGHIIVLHPDKSWRTERMR